MPPSDPGIIFIYLIILHGVCSMAAYHSITCQPMVLQCLQFLSYSVKSLFLTGFMTGYLSLYLLMHFLSLKEKLNTTVSLVCPVFVQLTNIKGGHKHAHWNNFIFVTIQFTEAWDSGSLLFSLRQLFLSSLLFPTPATLSVSHFPSPFTEKMRQVRRDLHKPHLFLLCAPHLLLSADYALLWTPFSSVQKFHTLHI